jgi:hypothetical protein
MYRRLGDLSDEGSRQRSISSRSSNRELFDTRAWRSRRTATASRWRLSGERQRIKSRSYFNASFWTMTYFSTIQLVKIERRWLSALTHVTAVNKNFSR